MTESSECGANCLCAKIPAVWHCSSVICDRLVQIYCCSAVQVVKDLPVAKRGNDELLGVCDENKTQQSTGNKKLMISKPRLEVNT